MGFQFKDDSITENSGAAEIKAEIVRLKLLAADFINTDKNVKVLLNSIYGVLGYLKFPAYFKIAALAITQQARLYNDFAELSINTYITKFWVQDKSLHKKMGITQASTDQSRSDFVVYMDTDSVFFDVQTLYRSCDYKANTGKSEEQFALELVEYRLDGFIDKQFDKLFKKHGLIKNRSDGKTTMNLEMEQVAESILWRAKKRYIKHLSWYKGVSLDRMKKVEIVGLETAQSRLPDYVRNHLDHLFRFIIDKSDSLSRAELAEKLKSIRDEFATIDIQDICIYERVSEYDKFVANDVEEVVINAHAKPTHKAAAYHNYLLRKNNMQNKYNFIGSRDRVKYYYINQDKAINAFGFLVDSFPVEFAPPIDYDIQFQKTILNPINGILKAVGMAIIPSHLEVMDSIFG